MAKHTPKPKSKAAGADSSPANTENVQPTPVVHKGVASPSSSRFLFDKTNYQWMIAGVVLILLGFALMSGGKSDNPHEFDYHQIYSFRRVTLAPLVVLLGFAVEFYAIMKRPANS